MSVTWPHAPCVTYQSYACFQDTRTASRRVLTLPPCPFFFHCSPQISSGDDEMKTNFLEMCSYVQGSYTEVSAFQTLNSEIERLEDEMAPEQPANRIFYLALPPQIFMGVTANVKQVCLSKT